MVSAFNNVCPKPGSASNEHKLTTPPFPTATHASHVLFVDPADAAVAADAEHESNLAGDSAIAPGCARWLLAVHAADAG